MCDGASASVLANRICTISNSLFTNAPFSLPWGSQVYAKIIATNVKGDSLPSLTGSGAFILKVPDSPINLANDPDVTIDT